MYAWKLIVGAEQKRNAKLKTPIYNPESYLLESKVLISIENNTGTFSAVSFKGICCLKSCI